VFRWRRTIVLLLLVGPVLVFACRRDPTSPDPTSPTGTIPPVVNGLVSIDGVPMQGVSVELMRFQGWTNCDWFGDPSQPCNASGSFLTVASATTNEDGEYEMVTGGQSGFLLAHVWGIPFQGVARSPGVVDFELHTVEISGAGTVTVHESESPLPGAWVLLGYREGWAGYSCTTSFVCYPWVTLDSTLTDADGTYSVGTTYLDGMCGDNPTAPLAPTYLALSLLLPDPDGDHLGPTSSGRLSCGENAIDFDLVAY